MTNYEKLFRKEMENKEFAKAYHEARLDRIFNEFLERLKTQIDNNESKEVLLKTINAMQREIKSFQ